MQSPIKMIATDLDGTFLTSDRAISESHKRAYTLAREEGIIFCLASGRAINTMWPFARQLGGDIPIVSANGAFVVDHSGGVVFQATLRDQIVDLLLDYAEARGIHVNVYEEEHIYCSTQDWQYDLYQARVGFDAVNFVGFGRLRGLSPTKLLFIDHPEAILAHRHTLQSILEPFGIPIVISEPDYLEFLPPGVNKGMGLASLAKHLGIEAHEVAAIGDWSNDLEMIRWAGLGAAVSNAAEDVKAAANLIVPSNDEGGVLTFVNHVLGREPAGIIHSRG